MGEKVALDGLRILDFTWVLAGPGAVRYLCDHGAEVIKVERKGEGDIGRRVHPFRNNVRGINLSGYYNNINRGKMGMTLNLADPRAQDIVKRLVKVCDVVFENFTAGVMRKFGLHYEVLRQVKPDIIMISMSGLGHSGVYRDYVTFGPALQALSGISYLMGEPQRDPAGFGYSYSDFTGGWGGVLPCLAALHYRNLTGKGQWVDAGQLEPLCALMGPGLLDYSVNKRAAQRLGNRLPWGIGAPHGCYRCLGDDRWCVISVFTDADWQGFCRALGNPPWTKDERFVTILARSQHQDELDGLVEEWTAKHTPEQVMELLQKAGVAAGVVQTSQDLVDNDPQLRHRGFWQYNEHPEIGHIGYEGVTFKLSETPGKVRGPAPLHGQHNSFVLGELLGMAEKEVKQLAAEGVI